MFITQRSLSRRGALKGIGVTLALPWLEAMMPAGQLRAATRTNPRPRLICIENVHGAAGCSEIGVKRNLWAPAAIGRDFDLTGTSLQPLQPFRDYLTIISNTDVGNADPFEAREIGGDHFRSSAVFLTQEKPKRTMGSDVEVGTSLDQIHAQRFGQDTPLPSLQLSIEPVNQGGGCQYGYSCTYVDTISWAAPNKPLPMTYDPRQAFDQIFGVFRYDSADRSILDFVRESALRLRQRLGAGDHLRLNEYLENVREIERRIQAVGKYNQSGEPRELPEAPPGVPDSFAAHVKLMIDLQLLALQSNVTRVVSFKLSRDGSNRTYPESGFNGPFHPTSHHGNKDATILGLSKINTYHVQQIAYLLERLRDTRDEHGSLLDSSLVLYGSPMGDPNLHNHKRVPFFLAGRAGGALTGGRHFQAKRGTPLANVMLRILQILGHDDMPSFGDSEGAFDLS